MANLLKRLRRTGIVLGMLATFPISYLALSWKPSANSSTSSRTPTSQVAEAKGLEQVVVTETTPQETLDALFRSFPDKIPGARSVDKYFIPGSRYCIVHVRQIHDEIGISFEKHPASIRAQILKVQGDIENIFSYLARKHQVQRVYSEGSIELEDTATKRAIIDAERKRLNSLEESGYASPKLISEIKDAIREAELSLKLGYWPPPESNSIYAVSRLAAQGKINLIPFDNWDNAKKMLDKSPLQEISQTSLMEEREDYFMQKIPRQANYFAFVVLGGMHCFGGRSSCGEKYPVTFSRENYKDNFDFQNRNYPDKKSSLIEITPASYPKED